MQLKARLLLVALLLVVARGAHAQDPPPAANDDDDGDEREPRDLSPEEIEDHSDSGPPITGTGRVGIYADSDHTTVYRTFGSIAKAFGNWTLDGSLGIDAVTSASVDVRSSPLGMVDTVTSASGMTSTQGGQMTDTRYQLTGGAGWKDGDGHAANVTSAVATENDYASISGGLNGSYDILDRTTTLLGGITLTDNWISSVLDSALHHKMMAVGWSAGVARVLTPGDAIRLRYDGKLDDGYLASPYRSVRFGDWTTTTNDTGMLVFANTIGSPGGLAERLPQTRLSTALTLEWVHSLASGVGLHSAVRVGHDDWGISSVTPSVDLRIARPGWRLQVGYRFYAQTHASFYESKYTMDPSQYSFWTSDKELGRQIGHLGELEISKVLIDSQGPNDTRMLLFFRADAIHYSYPGFVLLGARTSVFLETGLAWEL